MKWIGAAVKGVGKIVNLPEQVEKVQDRMDDIQTHLLSCVTQGELTREFELHREATSGKLDLVIDLLKKNGS
jgi:predicted nucleotidyltransferase